MQITREEAKAILLNNTDLGYGVVIEGESTAQIKEALNMAIKALEKEPCEDAISRQAVIDMTGLSNWFESSDDYISFVEEVCALPSVTPIRPKGVWETGYTYPDGEYWKCSVCKELIRVRFPMHFCPNCSADMRGEEEENKCK